MDQPKDYTLSQLARDVTETIEKKDSLNGVWVVGETMDVRVRGGHCYFELVEKDPTGKPIARMRANIWAYVFNKLNEDFKRVTRQEFKSDLKVKLRVSVKHHPVYGLALNVSEIDGGYTLGDAERKRREMIDQLAKEGIIDLNRNLRWPVAPQRIAVISAEGAAGYGDFKNQLVNNPYRLRFYPKLFPAVMQGDKAPDSIRDALAKVAAEKEFWDCVVIIRGGGATSDLAAYDNYDLAAAIAKFPLPVVIGIGHERDITLLDWVANIRAKTPTAAAEWLVQQGTAALARLQNIAQTMLQCVTDRLAGNHKQLAYISGQLPAAAMATLASAKAKLANVQTSLGAVAHGKLPSQAAKLDALVQALARASEVAINAQKQKLASLQALLDVLSPDATLKRGYSITRIDGRAITSASQVHSGAKITTTLASGEIVSIAE